MGFAQLDAVEHRIAIPAGAVSLAYSPDGNEIAVGTSDGRVAFYDTHTGKPTRELPSSGSRTFSVMDYARDGRPVSSDDLTLRAGIPGTPGYREVKLPAKILGVKTSPSGNRVLAVLDGGKAVTLGYPSLAVEHTFVLPRGTWGKFARAVTGGNDFIRGYSFSPDGKEIALGFDNGKEASVSLFDSVSGKLVNVNISPLSQLPNGKQPANLRPNLTGVDYSPDGKDLIVMFHSYFSNDRTWIDQAIYVPRDGKSAPRLVGNEYNASTNWPGNTQWIASHPSQPLLAKARSGTDGGQPTIGYSYVVNGMVPKVDLVNTQTGQVQKRLLGHSETVHFVQFSPDGNQLASVAGDGKLVLWKVDRLLQSPQKFAGFDDGTFFYENPGLGVTGVYRGTRIEGNYDDHAMQVKDQDIRGVGR